MAGSLEESLHCPTCLDILKDPVVLSCGDSFCRACLQQWKDNGERSCPICRTEMRSLEPPPSLALRNDCENVPKALVNSENICSLHQEKLKLFCLDHQELVCPVCRDTTIHLFHRIQPLEEVVKDHKKQLEKGLRNTITRLEDYIDCRKNCNEQAEYIKFQSEKVESKIKKDFEELRHFLDIEEKARVAAVREEEKKKSHFMKEKIAAFDREIAALSDAVRNAKVHLTSSDISFMRNFQMTVSRIQELPDKPELPRGALLDEAKHVGNLKFRVWDQIKQKISYSPIILDPNTAGPGLVLSEDLTSLTSEEVQQRPKNPERFKVNTVLGCALNRKRQVWEVEVGDNTNWEVGVVWGNPCFPAQMEGFKIAFKDGKYRKFDGEFGAWKPRVKVQRILLYIDRDWSFSMSESLTNTQLGSKNVFRMPYLSDNTKIYPFFFTMDKIPLKIFPKTISVSY
ncbi:E3 ubiquitin-protein ligase TRIM35-like [Corythoichthys intestinalis]|uniref:E3 ubiquitin-protein ligase TRIM35-like n=1 Tax=Corythoichthys intestinalis TaxID=161448 RepID=UPI0025A5ECE8|nr:E3 ubiquitin-protein ligase TRIM35-like [Corythoichthys intestinalis]